MVDKLRQVSAVRFRGITITHFLFYFSYALGVRKLVIVHHRAGYPKIQMKIKRHTQDNSTI